MIAQIEGQLARLDADKALVRIGAVCYEVMLPGYAVAALGSMVGQAVSLCTMEYFEGTLGGGNLIPRMVGFLSPAEREFFERFTSVKGMGIKKGLKSLAIPIATIAESVEAGDEKMLIALPGIGKRFAQLIIAELKGKLGDFAVGTRLAGEGGPSFADYQREALEILIAWGEKRAEVIEMIGLACKKYPDIRTAEQLVPLVYRLKQGVEV